ncbi:MAG: exo-alpha-sialidase [Promethearchaeota archaeon]
MATFGAEEIFKPGGCGGSSHGSTICEGADGELVAAWYGGSREKGLDVAVWMSRLPAGATSWTEPVVVEKESARTSEGNPVLFWDDRSDRLWLFWVTMYVLPLFGGGWSTAKVKCKASDDLGATWTEPRFLRDKIGWMTRHKPVRLSSGDMLLPVYSEFVGYKSFVLRCEGAEFAKGPLESRWTKHGRITGGVLQPTLAEIEPGRVLALMRTSRSGRFGGSLAAAESRDHGSTWSKARRTPLPNPNSGADVVKLSNGHLALAFNNSADRRTPLSVAISEDGGATWPHVRDLEDDPGLSFSYPAIVQASDGTLHVTYTNARANIKHAAFDEAWVLGES